MSILPKLFNNGSIQNKIKKLVDHFPGWFYFNNLLPNNDRSHLRISTRVKGSIGRGDIKIDDKLILLADTLGNKMTMTKLSKGTEWIWTKIKIILIVISKSFKQEYIVDIDCYIARFNRYLPRPIIGYRIFVHIRFAKQYGFL